MRVLERSPDRQMVSDQEVSLQERFVAIRQYSEEICRPLRTDDYVIQPVEYANPPKWHLGHTTWFFEEYILAVHHRKYRRYNPNFSYLFGNAYESAADRMVPVNRGNLSRPTVEEVLAYRRYVNEQLVDLIPALNEEGVAMLELGCHHEQQHQELLFSDIKFILGHNPMFPAYKNGFCETASPESPRGFAFLPEGEYAIGYQGYGFSYDNERSMHHVVLKPFQISKSLVTNEEYIEFIRCGGYDHLEYWHNDGFEWRKQNRITAPLYWHKMDGEWYRYALGGLEKVDREEPVTHVSFYEASAFANWRGMRLPTEFEWEAASDQFNWGQRWEHTSSAYLPYPGYMKPRGATAEYNGKFMVNTMVLRGASVVTPPGHSRKTYRNFYYPHLRWQFNGIRLCRD